MRYILGVSDVDYREVITLIRPHISERQASDMITTAQRLFDEGHQKGRKEGLDEGHQKGLDEGHQKGQAEALLRQIAKRYAVVPSDEVRRRVEGATSDERERWLERIFEAQSVEELLE